MSKIKCYECGREKNKHEEFLPGRFLTHICPQCASSDKYIVCSECGEATDRMFIEWYQDEIPVCSSCMQGNFCYCYECGEHISYNPTKCEYGIIKQQTHIHGSKLVQPYKM